MNALQLPPGRFSDNDRLSRRLVFTLCPGAWNHRPRGDQAWVALDHYPIIQSIPCVSSFIGKGYLLMESACERG